MMKLLMLIELWFRTFCSMVYQLALAFLTLSGVAIGLTATIPYLVYMKTRAAYAVHKEKLEKGF